MLIDGRIDHTVQLLPERIKSLLFITWTWKLLTHLTNNSEAMIRSDENTNRRRLPRQSSE